MINPKWVQVEILFGHWDTWVSYRDETDIECNLSGRTYRNIDQVHLNRIAYAANNLDNHYWTTIDLSGNGPQITIHRS